MAVIRASMGADKASGSRRHPAGDRLPGDSHASRSAGWAIADAADRLRPGPFPPQKVESAIRRLELGIAEVLVHVGAAAPRR